MPTAGSTRYSWLIVKPFFFLVPVVAILLGGCIAAPKAPEITAAQRAEWARVKTGPFAWGISTSSYQYEDPAVKPGTPEAFTTDWDLMVAKGAAPEKGQAVYTWTHFDKDLAALRKIGVTHYRFSLEWARIEPRPGEYNEDAIREYVGMARKLRAAGIEPVVCLWHFTFPDWLTDTKRPANSNWLHPLYAERWAAYVEKMARAMGPGVRLYAPQNEPNGQITTAYIAGLWPPRQVANFGNYNRAVAASAAGFRQAAAILKRVNPDALVLSVEALPWWNRSPVDVTHALHNFMQQSNFDHLDAIYDVCDVIGFNYYYSQVAGPMSLINAGSHRGPDFTMMGWDIDPEALYRQIKLVGERYGKPLMITENGIATADDAQRVRYIGEHLAAIDRAKADGSDVRGYFYWSLVDNYEWHYGYTATFGLARMNPKTYERQLKPSAGYYRSVIQKNRRR